MKNSVFGQSFCGLIAAAAVAVCSVAMGDEPAAQTAAAPRLQDIPAVPAVDATDAAQTAEAAALPAEIVAANWTVTAHFPLLRWMAEIRGAACDVCEDSAACPQTDCPSCPSAVAQVGATGCPASGGQTCDAPCEACCEFPLGLGGAYLTHWFGGQADAGSCCESKTCQTPCQSICQLRVASCPGGLCDTGCKTACDAGCKTACDSCPTACATACKSGCATATCATATCQACPTSTCQACPSGTCEVTACKGGACPTGSCQVAGPAPVYQAFPHAFPPRPPVPMQGPVAMTPPPHPAFVPGPPAMVPYPGGGWIEPVFALPPAVASCGCGANCNCGSSQVATACGCGANCGCGSQPTFTAGCPCGASCQCGAESHEQLTELQKAVIEVRVLQKTIELQKQAQQQQQQLVESLVKARSENAELAARLAMVEQRVAMQQQLEETRNQLRQTQEQLVATQRAASVSNSAQADHAERLTSENRELKRKVVELQQEGPRQAVQPSPYR